jgi:NAD(P)-dependent dehydrogenase (short-subunit alcohol dehydrogenase family)
MSDPDNPSKTALNSLTVQYAKEFAGTDLLVNAADPGYVATDLNNHTGVRTVEQGAAIAVRLATLGTDGPTGGFFDDDGPVPW